MYTPEELFNRWFLYPLNLLKEIPNGDGGFMALATSLILYERYATAVIKDLGRNPNDYFSIQLAEDFSIDERVANDFWDVIRNGILHQAMPKLKSHGVLLADVILQNDYSKPVAYNQSKNRLEVQPWLFMDRVLELWQSNVDLLDKNKSFPWANILPMEVINGDNNNEWNSPPTGSPSGLGQIS